MRKLLVAVLATLMAVTALAPMAMADPIGFDVGVDKYITATFNYAAVDFGNLEAGSSDTAALSVDYNVSVDTNYAYEVSALGANFTDGGGHDFYIGNLKMDAENSFGGLSLGAAVSLAEDEQVITGSWDYTDTTSFHGFWLSIPAAQYAAAYSSTVTITYANE